MDVFDYTWIYIGDPLTASDYDSRVHSMHPFKAAKYHAFLRHAPRLGRIRYSNQKREDGSHNLTLLFSSDELMHKFMENFNEASMSHRGVSYPSPRVYGTELYIYQIIFAIYKLMNEHISEFLIDVNQRARYIVFSPMLVLKVSALTSV